MVSHNVDVFKFVFLFLFFSVGDELAQVVGCSWIMRDSGGSLAQNRWQGDLGLTAVGQDNTGGGRHFISGNVYIHVNLVIPYMILVLLW